MIYKLLIVLAVIASECASAHHLRHHGGSNGGAKSLQDNQDNLPYGYKKLNKMMNKAILQIILGDLHPSDMVLLKALNYTLEEVMEIREQELSKLKQQDEQQRQALGGSKYQVHRRPFQRDASIDTYNKQAVYDYENAQTEEEKPVTEDNMRQSFDRVMEPHVVFKIRYDDSEFDSASDERAKAILKNHRTKTIFKLDRGNTNSATSESFQVDGDDLGAASPNAAALEATTSSRNLEDFNKQAIADYENLVPSGEQQDKREFANQQDFERSMNDTSSSTTRKPGGEYEGLEWIGDDVYRVVPEAMEAMLNYEDPEQIASIEALNDTVEYQNDAEAADGNFTENMNLTSYQRLALAQRKDQGQKAIEDIKMRILAMTGRFNQTSTNNQVQREKLTMFSPTCQTPRNTDTEAWSDSYLMNMHFQLNLTSGEHVLAAKLRLFKLPQESLVSSSTTSSRSNNAGSIYEEDEEDEKKIRVSVYFYTKSLKKHRVKKRLMDSIVTPLNAQGSHLALDVRQALRFWRPNAQQHNNSNHGLVVQVEDQDGRALKPSLYIQEPNCQTAPGQSQDDKAYQYVPALFIRACTRYVRFVNGKMEMYVQCRQRH